MPNNNPAKPQTNDLQNPLEAISEILEEDIKAFNTVIIDNMQSNVDMIPKLAGYLIAAGGKRIRPLLTLASTAIYSGEMTRAHILAAAVEFIHSATLLHDDVVDESTQRRGQDAANIVFGNQASVLVGDFLFSRAFQLMVSDGSHHVLKTLSDASAIIAQGEVMQLSMAGDLNITQENYLDIIKAKTAALFAAACEVGPLIADADHAAASAMAEYGLNMGIAFQIVDDALDYDANREKLGKTIGDDFREGKITAPVLIALQNASTEEQEFWNRTFSQQEQTPDDLTAAQNILKRHNAISQSLDWAKHYGEKAKMALAEAPDSPLRAHLNDLVTYSITRHQ